MFFVAGRMVWSVAASKICKKTTKKKKITGRGEWSVDIVGSKGVWAAYEVVGKVGEQGGMWYMHGFATDRLSKLRRVRAC